MPRHGAVPKRDVLPDPLYSNKLVTKFINTMLGQGKKSTAEQVFYGALRLIEDRTKTDPQRVFRQAVDNVKPVLEVKSRRVGGATYQVPVEVRPDRRMSLGLRWLVQYAKQRKDKRTITDKLVAEMIDASAGQGGAVKKREDTHRMAEANKAFAHYRW